MGIEKEVKFSNRYVEVSDRPVMIVGQNPGRQRKGERTYRAWEGNPSSDFLNEVLKKETNYILTNVTNYQSLTIPHIEEGLMDLFQLICEHNPIRIITLGEFCEENVRLMLSMTDIDIEVFNLQHPSYIVRFRRDKKEYMKKFKEVFHGKVKQQNIRHRRSRRYWEKYTSSLYSKSL